MTFKEKLSNTATFLLLTGVIYEGTRFTFDLKNRQNIYCRDAFSCQKCGNKTDIAPHHIVPECILNGSKTSAESDSYNSVFILFYRHVLETIPGNKVQKFSAEVAKKIKDEDNGVTLCKKCHQGIHRGHYFEDRFELNPLPLHKERPLRLDDSRTIILFFRDNILNPAMDVLGLERIEDTELENYLRILAENK